MRVDAEIAGRFHILAQVGAGAMGEVYRARDTRLGRDVALKVLSSDSASDPDRLRRFEHEARAAAALNHPNILALHDVGEHEGTPYLVTELLEGESLRERITRGPLPVKEAARIGVQVARGLAAAHGKGIVHRDLKPENVFITTDGTVKILDFGLASLRSEAEETGPSTESSTETELTRAGTVLGTAGYMAPEQVRGQRVDQRADIFAFGCVLYEMLSGRRAFAGDTPADTMGAILKDEPASVRALAGDVTPALAQLVARCLEKRPEDRFSSAHDLALALADAVGDVDPRGARAVTAAQPIPRRRIFLALIAATVVAAVVATVWLVGGSFGGPTTPINPSRVMVAPFQNVTGEASLDAIAARTADAIGQGLAELSDVDVVPAPRGTPADDERALCVAAQAAGAGVLASGSYYLSGDTLELRGQITDPMSGRPIYILDPARGPRTEPDDAVDRVRQRAMSAVLMHLGRAGCLGAVTRPPLYSALQEWVSAMMAIGIDWRTAAEHIEKAVQLDPEFWPPQSFLLVIYRFLGEDAKLDAVRRRLHDNQGRMSEAERLLMQHFEALSDGRPVEALRQGQALLALAPHDLCYRLEVSTVALGINRPREVIDCAGDLGALDWARLRTSVQASWLIRRVAEAQHLLGEHEAELETIHLGLEHYPDSLSLRQNLVAALAALGRVADLEREIGQALLVRAETRTPGNVLRTAAMELDAHGHPQEARRIALQGAEWYAQRSGEDANPFAHIDCLTLAHRYDEAARLAAELHENHPQNTWATACWGLSKAREGDQVTAQAVDRTLAGIPDNGFLVSYIYWQRAAIAAQLGHRDCAMELLREALARFPNPEAYLDLHKDPDLAPLRGYPPFEELLRPKG